ncbi:MAG TPA: acetate kinase [Coleofasciculaceae cyanobacterium]|jgi:acetate kinase
MKVLVLNAGSSSQKSCLYQLGDTLPELPPPPLWEAKVDWTKHPGMAQLEVKARGTVLEEELQTTSRPDVIAHMLETLWSGQTQVIADPSEINVVGHRVVHGGQEYQKATQITPEVKEAIARLSTFAPVHNPANLEGIETIEKILGSDTPQVAVFDTAFHSTVSPAAATYPVPYEWFEQGIRRYGFHGISHQYCAHRTAELMGKDLASVRLITCHLGNGASLAAIRDGQSVDTTMGFTPLEGLMMGTRSGSIDPGILIHLLQHADYDAQKLDDVLNKASGLKGISGVSGDLRQIMIGIEEGDSRSQLAFDMYVHSLRKHIGAMLATLGGLDALVFTGGVGENSAAIRASACEAFGFLGLKLDREKNNASPVDTDIAAADSAIRVFVVHTEEDWAIAQECWQL